MAVIPTTPQETKPMINVVEKDAAAFLVNILGIDRRELKKLAAIFNDSMSETLRTVIEHGLKALNTPVNP